MTGVRAHPDVDALVQQITELRPLPAAAARVLAIAESEQFSAHELAQAVSADAALTAKVLRLANSAYYGFPRRIGTVRDAVVLLGFRAVRSATLAASVIEALPRGQNTDERQFWQFCVTVGMLSEVMARATHRPAEEAFSAGVLHNIGRMALDHHRPADLRRAIVLARQEGMSVPQAEQALLGFTDAELGGALALHWNFPGPLVEAVANHASRAHGLADPDSLPGLVSQARGFAHSHGVTDGVDEPARTDPARAWFEPPVAPVLQQGGGLDGLLQRAGVFIEHTIGSP